jgi:putative ABC transport system substrate-binding protein
MAIGLVLGFLGNHDIRRREFMGFLGGAVVWPCALRAQQPERVRRIGVFQTTGASDPQGQARNAAFLQGL